MSEAGNRKSEFRGAVGDGRVPFNRIGCRDVQDAVAFRYGLLRRSLLSARRHEEVSRPRQLAMWICLEVTGQSSVGVGRAFDRDHTTVLYAARVVPERLSADADYRRECLAILKKLRAPAESTVVQFPAGARAAGPTDRVDSAIAVLVAELERDPAGTLAKLLRRTVDGPEIEIR